jgi:hypothetical protein
MNVENLLSQSKNFLLLEASTSKRTKNASNVTKEVTSRRNAEIRGAGINPNPDRGLGRDPDLTTAEETDPEVEGLTPDLCQKIEEGIERDQKAPQSPDRDPAPARIAHVIAEKMRGEALLMAEMRRTMRLWLT